MAQPNVVREPSMEEILASIRRIIESNEPGAGNAISSSLPPVYAVSDEERDDDIHLTVDDTLASTEFGDTAVAAAVDPRFVAANSPGPVPEAEPARTLSLADVAARVRAASERNAAQLNGTRDLQHPRELPPAMAARLSELKPAAEVFAAPETPSVPEVRHDPAPRSAPEFPPISSAADVAPAAEVRPEPAQPQLRSVVVEAVQSPAPQIKPRTVTVVAEVKQAVHASETPILEQQDYVAPAVVADVPSVDLVERPAAAENRFLPQVQEEVQQGLLSDLAGAQVARSFDELAAAIDGSERRSLDEITQEMLRPMLQEWLDDNLPTLVERLVREEIERVARGPRR